MRVEKAGCVLQRLICSGHVQGPNVVMKDVTITTWHTTIESSWRKGFTKSLASLMKPILLWLRRRAYAFSLPGLLFATLTARRLFLTLRFIIPSTLDNSRAILLMNPIKSWASKSHCMASNNPHTSSTIYVSSIQSWYDSLRGRSWCLLRLLLIHQSICLSAHTICSLSCRRSRLNSPTVGKQQVARSMVLYHLSEWSQVGCPSNSNP